MALIIEWSWWTGFWKVLIIQLRKLHSRLFDIERWDQGRTYTSVLTTVYLLVKMSPLDAPMQNIDYSEIFHQVDKENTIEAKCVLEKQGSKKYGWLPAFLF